MDLVHARELINGVIETWYSKGELDLVDISLLEIAVELMEDNVLPFQK